MVFIDGQVLRPAIDLSRAGKNNLQIPIVQAARFEDMKLRRGIDV